MGEKKKKRAEARKNKMVRSKERGDKKMNDPTLMKTKNDMKTAKNENESTASDMSHVFDGLDTIGKALIDNVQHELQRKNTANLLFSGSSKISQSGSSQHRMIHRTDLFSGSKTKDVASKNVDVEVADTMNTIHEYDNTTGVAGASGVD